MRIPRHIESVLRLLLCVVSANISRTYRLPAYDRPADGERWTTCGRHNHSVPIASVPDINSIVRDSSSFAGNPEEDVVDDLVKPFRPHPSRKPDRSDGYASMEDREKRENLNAFAGKYRVPIHTLSERSYLAARDRFIGYNGTKLCQLQIVFDYTFIDYVNSLDVKLHHMIRDVIDKADFIFRNIPLDYEYLEPGFHRPTNFVGLSVWRTEEMKLERKAKWTYSAGIEYARTMDEYQEDDPCLVAFFTHHPHMGRFEPVPIGTEACYVVDKKVVVNSYRENGPNMTGWSLALELARQVAFSFNVELDEQENTPMVSGNLCTPPPSERERDGYFIMTGREVVNGSKKNHFRFSRCSLYNIYLFLTGNMAFCLEWEPFRPTYKRDTPLTIYSEFARCGNGWKDPGEECDCGFRESDCMAIDPCCTNPSFGDADRACKYRESSDPECRGPERHPCCDGSCRLIRETNVTCSRPDDGECLRDRKCDGISVRCPLLAEEKLCGLRTKTCNGVGLCKGSVCKYYDYADECDCPDPNLRCHVCCRRRIREESQCVPLFDIISESDKLPKPDLKAQFRKRGVKCDEDRICDGGGRCVLGRSTPIMLRKVTIYELIVYCCLSITILIGIGGIID